MYKNNQNQGKLIEILKELCSKEGDILFAYLFGSFAYKNITSESDVDIAIYLDEKKSDDLFKRRLDLISKFSQALKKEADIIILNTAPLFLKYVILSEGKLIIEKNQSKRIDFELKTTNEYFDSKPIIEMYHKRLLNV